MMPLSFAGLISGMMTLVATPPNMVVNSELLREGIKGFGFFGVTPIGLIILLMGLATCWLPATGWGKAGKFRKRAAMEAPYLP